MAHPWTCIESLAGHFGNNAAMQNAGRTDLYFVDQPGGSCHRQSHAFPTVMTLASAGGMTTFEAYLQPDTPCGSGLHQGNIV